MRKERRKALLFSCGTELNCTGEYATIDEDMIVDEQEVRSNERKTEKTAGVFA